VIVNGQSLLELDRDQLLPGAERTADYLPAAGHHRRPGTEGGGGDGENAITFPSRGAFLGLPQMRAYLDLSLRLAFRTRESAGLLVYNAGRRSDFLAVELVDGHIHLVAAIGGRTVELKDNYPEAVSDNQWHVLVVARTGKPVQYFEKYTLLNTIFFPPTSPSFFRKKILEDFLLQGLPIFQGSLRTKK
jgi:hypothetical protein